MARYILIDNASGYIFGDTDDYAPGRIDSPMEACETLDREVVQEHGRTYELVSRLASNETGYLVYSGDVDATINVENGQDENTIDYVLEHCPLVATIRCTKPDA